MAAKPIVVVETGADGAVGNQHGTRERTHTGEKRKSDGGLVNSEPVEKKKFSLSMNSSPGGPSAKKISISLGNPGKPPTTGQNSVTKAPVNPVKLSMSSKPNKDTAVNLKKTAKVASVFNDEDDSEEEMPPEAKMRMKNIGRNTPTAAGPNSFGKSRLGFCDRQKVLEREIKQQMDETEKD
ncbi:PEST proteolytic signal-containing nuclear protein-like [Liolophura sinensis]|uniref:PEST proteolytic signal-containing nuclear protein-like n=1 Tax=Liolophura sinensis TaxID=3198878 RepID=UPI00315927DC